VFLESRSVERHSALDVGAKYEGFGRQCPKKLLPMMYHIGKFFAFAKFILKKSITYAFINIPYCFF